MSEMGGSSRFLKLLGIGAAALLLFAPEVRAQDGASQSASASSDTVHVAPPTGETETDRTNVQAAFDAVQPGGTILFAPGVYLLGAGAKLTVPDVTVLGHPEGTVLRGCDPEGFGHVFECGGLYVQTERQTIRRLTFEYTWHGIVVGPFPASTEEFDAVEQGVIQLTDMPAGGQRIEGNTFRASPNGLRMLGTGEGVSVVRDNDFVDVFHAVGIYGASLHFLDNRVTVEEPGRIPYYRHPGSAIMVLPGRTDCAGHVIAGNRIDGYPDPIYVLVRRGDGTCRGVEIRDNTIHASRVKMPEAWGGYRLTDEDSTMVGAPITLMNRTEPGPGVSEAETEGVLEDVLVTGNLIIGAEGLGILVQGVSRSQITRNTITGIQRRDPFPGITWDGFAQQWEVANGSGIWLSPGSAENEIVGNSIENVAAYAVVVEGDSNRVETWSARDSVRDLGSGNRVIAATARTAADTTRFTIIINGHRKAERRMWQEAPDTWRYEYEGDWYDSYHFPRSERLVLDAEGLPIQVEIRGAQDRRGTWEERFERRESRARWSTLTRWRLFPFDPPDLFGGDPFKEVGKESADTLVVGPAYYAAVYPVHDVGVAARALLRRPDRFLPLLPGGEARLEILGDRGVEVNGRSLRTHLYAVHGLDLRPVYVWLDEDGATFADEWSIRAGWEAVFPELRAAMEQALADHHGRLAEGLVPPVRERPLVIRGVRLFDPASGTTRPNFTIVVEGDRIAAVGADGSMDLPPEAEIIDATGRTALPGLWDMHAHHGIPSLYLELDAPLHLAGGITTARDLGSHIGPILSLRSRIESSEALGPRLLLSGFIDGPGRRPSGVLVESAAEARAAVDRFAELGYVQIKIYGQVPPAFVPEIVARAREHGLRVSGHVPDGMALRDAVEAGFDEIQHADHFFRNLGPVPVFSEDLEAFMEAIDRLTADSVRVRELVGLMVTHEVGSHPDRVRPLDTLPAPLVRPHAGAAAPPGPSSRGRRPGVRVVAGPPSVGPDLR